ncbi:LysR family transcriptional regulator [Leucobacter sp. HY1910]
MVTPELEIRALKYFVAAAEAGSLTAAATALSIAQPSLSVAISRLERQLGVELLSRSSRGVRPTAAGRYLLGAASKLLGDVDAMTETIGRFSSGLEGAISVASVPILMWQRVPTLLRELAREAPHIEVRLGDPPPWEAIDMLHARTVDIAALAVADAAHFARQHRAEFDIYDWGDIPLVAALPPELHELPDPLPLGAFEGKTLVQPHRTAAVPSAPEAVDAALARHGVKPATVRVAETIQSGMSLIEAGLGWGIVPDADRASLTRFRVETRSLTPAPDPLRALVLTRKGAAARPEIGRMIRIITNQHPNRV